ncbi:hypothetical protein OfM2_15340 [Lactovum odontotermitis]
MMNTFFTPQNNDSFIFSYIFYMRGLFINLRLPLVKLAHLCTSLAPWIEPLNAAEKGNIFLNYEFSDISLELKNRNVIVIV